MKLSAIKREVCRLEPRRSHRIDLMTRGEVVLRDGSHRCTILEISAHGGLLELSARAEVGQDGLLRCDGLDLLFSVVRVQGDLVAVEFVDESGGEEQADFDHADRSRIDINREILRFINP